jgi:hypothetical protein
LAAGVVLTRPLGVRDFRYRFEPLAELRGELMMTPELNTVTYLRCRVQFAFTEDGWLAGTPSIRIDTLRTDGKPT